MNLSFGSKISNVEKLLFLKHLSVMMKSGLTIREGVKTIRDQTKSKQFKKILSSILNKIDNGESLSSSLEQHPKTFSPLFINMVAAGESSGTIEKSLSYLYDQLEKTYTLKKKIISAMLYPFIVVFATIGVSGVLAFFVLPKLVPLFNSLDVELPLFTRILLKITDILQNQGLLVLIITIVLILFLYLIAKIRPVKRVLHFLVLKMPIIGQIIQNMNLALISRTLGVLLESGMPVVKSINVTANTINNLSYNKVLKQAEEDVKTGENLSSLIEKNSSLFPDTFTKMVEVGERTGSLGSSFLYLAEFYEEEVDDTTQRLSSILEPVLLVVIGLSVAFITVSIISPIYQITEGLR